MRDSEAATTVDDGCSSQAKQATEDRVHPSPFIPLRLIGETASAIELVHLRGHVLRIPSGFDVESLQKVLGLLDREMDG